MSIVRDSINDILSIDNKIDKIIGKSLSTEDYTTADKNKLFGIATNANNYSHPTSGVSADTYRSVTVDANGHVTAGTNPTTLLGYGITDADTSAQVTTKINNAVAALVDASPTTLDTLNELAAALGDDPNFATTTSTALGNRVVKNADIVAGTGTKVTYDAKGLVTGSSTPTTLAGYSISDAYTKTEVNNSMALKVDKVTGKGLSTEDYTSIEKSKLAGIADSANNYSLPVATNTVLGGVKAGANVSIDAAGVISASASGGAVPVGTIITVCKNTAPTEYLKANGALVSRTVYAALFTAIGTTFGAGDGSTTFALPDLRGYFPRGWDDSRGIDTNRVFGSNQDDDFKSHTHANSFGVSWELSSTTVYNNNKKYVDINQPLTATGGTETRPKNIALLYCIKY